MPMTWALTPSVMPAQMPATKSHPESNVWTQPVQTAKPTHVLLIKPEPSLYALPVITI